MADSKKIKFWKPGTEGPGKSLEEEKPSMGDGNSTSFVYNRYASVSIEQQRQRLPVFKHRNHILYLLEKHQTVIIVGETGSGKSTQIPQYLLEAGWAEKGHLIGVTQPRRVAVVTVANRVAEEKGSILGSEVGYAIRFDDCWDARETKIKFLTDGLLVREMMQDPLLSRYSVLMLDEAHERTLYTDIVIGLLKKIMKKRKDLRLIIASATLDAERFRDFFNDNNTDDPDNDTAVVLSVEGREYPVDIHYSEEPVPDYVKGTVETVMKIHTHEGEGDVLCFLTGQEEVETAVSLLVDEARKLPRSAMKMMVLPMYGSLPSAEQLRVFKRTPHATRKIVVATNIAEASITINQIVYVVDCGFVKIKALNSAVGIESLVIIASSQASSVQRAGRAGRVRSGKAYRLYTEAAFSQLQKNAVPEMQRTQMAGVVLQLKAMGIDNVLRFDFLSPPPAQNLVCGLELLYALGAIDENARLTSPLGLRMAEFPLEPMMAKMLLASDELGCSAEMLTVAAMMQIQNVFITPHKAKSEALRAKRRFSAEEGDHLSLLNVYNAFIKFGSSSKWCHANFLNYKGLVRATTVREQLKRYLAKFHIAVRTCGQDMDAIRKCICCGLFANAARYHYTGVYKTLRDEHELAMHPTSVLFTEQPPRWLVFNEVVHTTKEFMRDVTVVKPEWLHELAPHYYEFGTDRELMAKRAKLN